MTTLALTPVHPLAHPLVQTVAKACAGDEGTAQVLVRMALYDALCADVDELRPEIEAAVSKVLSREAARGLQALAKRDITPETAKAAEQLWALVKIGKAADDPRTPYWDARGEGGRFVSGSGRRGLADGLKMLTAGRGQDSLETRAEPALRNLVGQQATTYSRARVVGNALTAVDSPETRALGTLARVVGEIGPEAQAALEPGIRRAAYRYRGTERRPDVATQRTSALLAEFAENGAGDMSPAKQEALIRFQQELSASNAGDTMSAAGMRGGPRREVLSEAAAALATAQAATESGLSPDQVRLDAVGTYGVLKLRKQVPDLKVAELSLASGKMPPSLGLLMDADGRVVSESMGFNGDHYLPFDLKNLKALKGGQYVRTRTSGGPTDEDIYTGLLTGARQIEVVSNSGVFKVEFDPDLRGGRRYSDKARQMVDRYAKLVATIEGGDFEKTPMSRERLAELKEQAIAQATGSDGRVNIEMAEAGLKTLQAEAIRADRFNEVDEDALMDQARQIAISEYKQGLRDSPNKPRVSNRTMLQTQKDVFNELKTKAYKDRQQRYQADGEGYEAALKALKQEFPYFVRRTEFTPLGEYLIERKQLSPAEKIPGNRGKDKGYTPRRGLDPSGVPASMRRRTPTADSLRGGGGAPAAAAQDETGPAQSGGQGTQEKAPLGQSARPASTSTATEAAPALSEAVKSPDAIRELRVAIDPVFRLTNALIAGESLTGPLSDSDKTIEAAIANKLPGGIMGYLATQTNDVGGTENASRWLLGAATADQVSAVKDALKSVLGVAARSEMSAEAEADGKKAMTVLSQIEAAKRGFAEPVGAPEQMDPMGAGVPQPVAFPEVMAAGASLKNLQALVALPANREVAALADAYLARDDKEIAQEISDLLDSHNKARSGAAEGADAANLAADLKDPAGKEMTKLRTMQQAFALKRANQVAALAAGKAPRPFSDPTFGKRARPPLRVLSPSDPVAKALASRLRARR